MTHGVPVIQPPVRFGDALELTTTQVKGCLLFQPRDSWNHMKGGYGISQMEQNLREYS